MFVAGERHFVRNVNKRRLCHLKSERCDIVSLRHSVTDNTLSMRKLKPEKLKTSFTISLDSYKVESLSERNIFANGNLLDRSDL